MRIWRLDSNIPMSRRYIHPHREAIDNVPRVTPIATTKKIKPSIPNKIARLLLKLFNSLIQRETRKTNHPRCTWSHRQWTKFCDSADTWPRDWLYWTGIEWEVNLTGFMKMFIIDDTHQKVVMTVGATDSNHFTHATHWIRCRRLRWQRYKADNSLAIRPWARNPLKKRYILDTLLLLKCLSWHQPDLYSCR